MAYSETVEKRIDAVAAAKGWQLDKTPMFGTMAYKTGDKLCFTVRDDGIMLRADEALSRRLAALEGAQPAVMGERVMKGWWQVSGEVIAKDVVLLKLLEHSKAYADSL